MGTSNRLLLAGLDAIDGRVAHDLNDELLELVELLVRWSPALIENAQYSLKPKIPKIGTSAPLELVANSACLLLCILLLRLPALLHLLHRENELEAERVEHIAQLLLELLPLLVRTAFAIGVVSLQDIDVGPYELGHRQSCAIGKDRHSLLKENSR